MNTLYTVKVVHTVPIILLQHFSSLWTGSLASKRLWTSCGNCGMEMTAGSLWQVGAKLQDSRRITLSLMQTITPQCKKKSEKIAHLILNTSGMPGTETLHMFVVLSRLLPEKGWPLCIEICNHTLCESTIYCLSIHAIVWNINEKASEDSKAQKL